MQKFWKCEFWASRSSMWVLRNKIEEITQEMKQKDNEMENIIWKIII